MLRLGQKNIYSEKKTVFVFLWQSTAFDPELNMYNYIYEYTKFKLFL